MRRYYKVSGKRKWNRALKQTGTDAQEWEYVERCFKIVQKYEEKMKEKYAIL